MIKRQALHEGIITLIPRRRKSTYAYKGWRPIKLLSVDYKIISTAISYKIERVLVPAKLMDPTQTVYTWRIYMYCVCKRCVYWWKYQTILAGRWGLVPPTPTDGVIAIAPEPVALESWNFSILHFQVRSTSSLLCEATYTYPSRAKRRRGSFRPHPPPPAVSLVIKEFNCR